MVVIHKKEDQPESADHSRSKPRNQRWIDFSQSTTSNPKRPGQQVLSSFVFLDATGIRKSKHSRRVVVIRQKENRPEAADYGRSNPRNQRGSTFCGAQVILRGFMLLRPRSYHESRRRCHESASRSANPQRLLVPPDQRAAWKGVRSSCQAFIVIPISKGSSFGTGRHPNGPRAQGSSVMHSWRPTSFVPSWTAASLLG